MKKKTKKIKDKMYIELEGKVYLIQITGKKKVKTPLDNELVLRMLKYLLEQSIIKKLENDRKENK